jgi:hypothetical protein
MGIAGDAPVSVVTEQQRVADATRRLCQALGVGVLKPKALKHLAAALTEAAADEIPHNHDFAARILTLFRELAVASGHATSSRLAAMKVVEQKLEPVGHVDLTLLGPDKPLDPYVLRQLYGNTQLRLALQGRSVAALKLATAIVERQHPGTKPTSRTQKAALIDYIVRLVTGDSA